MTKSYCVKCGVERRANHARTAGFCEPCGAAYQADYRKRTNNESLRKIARYTYGNNRFDVVCANCHRERTHQRKLERAA